MRRRLPSATVAVAAVAAALALGGCVAPGQLPQPPVRGATQTAQAPAAVPAQAPAAANAETLQALGELIELKEELKKLRNAVEEIQRDREDAKWRQQNLFQDLDRRVLAMEREWRLLATQPQSPRVALPPADDGAAPAVTPGGAAVTTDGGDADIVLVVPAGSADPATEPPTGEEAQPRPVSVQEQEAHDRALDLLKQSRFQDAIDAFQQLADTWPDSQLADDAYYWMSEARYVNREYEAALGGFRTVLARYPSSPRVPKALLKTGYIRYDIGAYQEAAEIFREVIERFPGHEEALSAQTRLRRIEQTIQ